ncbi:hypothetical protein FRB99_001719, partial [Tulasnella sp. 403]
RISGITTTIDKSARRFTFDLAVTYCLDDATTDDDSPVHCMISVWRIRMCEALAGLVAEHLRSYPTFGEDIGPRSMSLRGDLLLRAVKHGLTTKLASLYYWQKCTAASHRKAVALVQDRRITGVQLISDRRFLVVHKSGVTIYAFGDLADTADLQGQMVVNPITPTWSYAFWRPVTTDTIAMSPEMPMSLSSTDPIVVSVYAHRMVYTLHVPKSPSEEVKVTKIRSGDQTRYSFILMGLQCYVWWHWLPTLTTLNLSNFTRLPTTAPASKVADGLVVAKWRLNAKARDSHESCFDEPSGRLLILSEDNDPSCCNYIILDF